jgi:macrolide-specific efflux system membrane fusion protein
MKRKGTVQPTRRYNVIGLLAFVSLIGAGGYWFVSANQKPQTEYLHPVAVIRGTIEVIITAQGKLEPKEYVDVGTQVSGQLKHIHVNIGDTVQQGQLLAEIDPRVYQAQVEANAARLQSLRAQLHEQKAQTKLAQQVLARNQNLFAVQAISQQVLQESEAQAAVAEARVGAITAQIKEVESNLQGNRTNLEFTKIYAPMAGTVTTMSAREGQTLNANQTAPIILQIANLDMMTVRAQVAEADVMRLQEGMPAYFTTLGDTEHRWEGKVRQILPAPDILNDVVLYNILIDVKNTDRQLMTGMTTQVFFICARAENVPTIPAEALSQYVPQRDNDSGKAYRIQVLTDAGAEERFIHVGLQTRTQAQVTAGLDAGDRILLKRPTRSETVHSSARRDGAGRFNRGPQL